MSVDAACAGIWDRSDSVAASDYNFIRGLQAGVTWADLEPTHGDFKYELIDDLLENASAAGKCFYTQVNVGPDSPSWIYDKGVPQVKTTGGKDKFPVYPYYLDSKYKTFFYAMVDSLADHLRNHKHASTVSFVQVDLGCTGDAVAYKGTPKNKAYEISAEQWKDFSVESVEHFNKAFQSGSGRRIPLMTNGDDADEYAASHVELAGIKGSAFVRAHHLTGERSWVESHRSHMLDTPADQKWLFTRAEADQTWNMMPAFQLNVPLGFYWGMISGVNQGLMIHDVTKSGFQEMVSTLAYTESLDLFNKYAPQIFPDDSTSAFIALHQGLDADDTEQFPIDTYGDLQHKAQKVERAQKICEAHAAQYNSGCKLDDPDSVAVGQVAQRHQQTGYNDVGYDIWPTNYGRWLEQIDADETSQGLFRIGGKLNSHSPVYSRFARGLRHQQNKTGMYFAMRPEFFSATPAGKLHFRVVWYDSEAGSWQLKYASTGGGVKSRSFEMAGDGTWKTATFTLSDAAMDRSHIRGSDFAIVSKDSTDAVFHMIEIDRGSTQRLSGADVVV